MKKALDTGERLMKIETSLDYLTQQQKDNETRNISEHEEIKMLIKDFIDSADKRYAGKPSEWISYGLVAILLSAIVYALIRGLTL